MNESTRILLELMLKDARDIIIFIRHVGTYDDFLVNVMAQKAIVLSLLNIGEQANRLPEEFTNQYHDIPWKQMVRMRHV